MAGQRVCAADMCITDIQNQLQYRGVTLRPSGQCQDRRPHLCVALYSQSPCQRHFSEFIQKLSLSSCIATISPCSLSCRCANNASRTAPTTSMDWPLKRIDSHLHFFSGPAHVHRPNAPNAQITLKNSGLQNKIARIQRAAGSQPWPAHMMVVEPTTRFTRQAESD